MHPLIEKSFRYKENNSKIEPSGYTFDKIIGLWKKGNTFLVESSDRSIMIAGTKKADQETGEDQKGR